MMYTVFGERMTAGQVWDAWVNQSRDEFVHVFDQNDPAHSLGEEVARYVAELPQMFDWDDQGIAWTDDDLGSIADAMLAYLGERGHR